MQTHRHSWMLGAAFNAPNMPWAYFLLLTYLIIFWDKWQHLNWISNCNNISKMTVPGRTTVILYLWRSFAKIWLAATPILHAIIFPFLLCFPVSIASRLSRLTAEAQSPTLSTWRGNRFRFRRCASNANARDVISRWDQCKEFCFREPYYIMSLKYHAQKYLTRPIIWRKIAPEFAPNFRICH